MAITMSQAPTALGCEPSYILVTTDGAASLPALRTRVITLPDGTKTVIEDELSRIGPANYAAMARVSGGSNSVMTADSAAPAKGWYFRGIRWQSENLYLMRLTGFLDGAPHAGRRAASPHRLFMNQCSAETDLADMGASFGAAGRTAFSVEGSHIAVVNGLTDRFYATGSGGDDLQIGVLEGPGPIHIGNNEIRAMAPALFTGGSGGWDVGSVLSNLTFQRNWQVQPTEWRASELLQGTTGTQVTIAADGITVTKTNGRSWADNEWPHYSPGKGAILYDIATGKARRVQFTFGNDSQLVLESPGWGGAATLDVGLQRAQPLVLYNSGLDAPMPTATTSTTSATVTFSAPLPAGPRAGHYFYLNNLRLQDYPNGGVQGEAVIANYSGRGQYWGAAGITVTQCKRKRILSIAADRLSCVLGHDTAGDRGFYWETHTFPFSIVTSDGLYRTARPKGREETKVGVRFLFQGNVMDFQPDGITQHPTNQSMDSSFNDGQLMTVTGTAMANVSGGFIFFDSDVARRKTFGEPWPICWVVRQPSWALSPVRELDDVIPGSTTATLKPFIMTKGGQFGDSINASFCQLRSETPWWTCSDHIWRFNIGIGWYGGSSYHATPNPPYTTMGKNSIHHDNLYIHAGHVMFNNSGANSPLGMKFANLATEDSPIMGVMTRQNSDWRYSNNTVVHVTPRVPGSIFAIREGPGPFPLSLKASRIEAVNNLFVGLNVGGSNSINFFTDTSNNPVNDVTQVWEPPFTVARNILAGSFAPVTKANLVLAAPTQTDNVALDAETKVGFRNYTGPDPYDLTNYIIDDVYATGTVTIAADGLSATLTSGTFPVTVAVGQFFRTATDATLKQITGIDISTLTTVRWTTEGAHPQAGQTLGFTIGFKNAGTNGVTPGANIDLLAQLTAGVRTRLIP